MAWLTIRILGEDELVVLERFRLALLVDGLDPELVLFALLQTIHLGFRGRRFATRHPLTCGRRRLVLGGPIISVNVPDG